MYPFLDLDIRERCLVQEQKILESHTRVETGLFNPEYNTRDTRPSHPLFRANVKNKYS